MPTKFKLTESAKENSYNNLTKEEKQRVRKEMVEMAKVRGVKPTARYYNTYPSTVKRWIKKENCDD